MNNILEENDSIFEDFKEKEKMTRLIFDDYDSVHPDVQKAVDELLASGLFQVVDKVKEIKGGYGSIALRKIS